MAAAAVGTKFAVMDVVRAMTVAAVPVDALDLVQGYSMAVVAGDLDMSAVQREVGLLVVIEGPDVPGNGVVAAVAAIPEISSMRIVVTVARHAANVFI